jgi:uncharacterized membrane protein YphA (DoxX/SURF4 family)
MTTHRRWTRVLAYVLGILVGLVFIIQGVMKFDPQGFWTSAFERWGYPVWFRYTIGVLETAGGVLLFVPRFATYAAGLLIVIMVGAFVTRLGDGRTGDVIAIGVYMALLAWFAYVWRNRRWPRARPEA